MRQSFLDMGFPTLQVPDHGPIVFDESRQLAARWEPSEPEVLEPLLAAKYAARLPQSSVFAAVAFFQYVLFRSLYPWLLHRRIITHPVALPLNSGGAALAAWRQDPVDGKTKGMPVSKTATMTFRVKSWDEQPFQESADGSKLTRASVIKAYKGDLQGKGELEMVMAYRRDGTAIFTGIEYVDGSILGRAGTFVLHSEGTFERDVVKTTWTVIAGTGTGELTGLQGTVQFEGGHAESYDVNLKYSFE